MKYLLILVLITINSLELLSLNKDSLLQVVKTTRNDSVKVSTLNDLAFAEIHSNANEALQYLSKSEYIARSKNLNYGLTQMFCIKAIVYDIDGKRDSARYYFNESLKLSRKFGYKNLEVRALNGLGMNSWNSSKFDQALTYFFEALNMNEDLKSPNQLSPSIFYNNIGLIYQEMSFYEKALFYHQKAYQIRADNSMMKEIAVSLNNIGICYKNTGKRDMAISTFKEGIKAAETSGNKFEYYKLINNLAIVYILQKKYREALVMLHKVIEKRKEVVDNPRTLLILYGTIATAYSADNKPDKSYYYAKEGLKILEKNPGLKSFSSDIYQMLIRNSYILGFHEDGDTYIADNKKILDEKFSKESAEAIAEMEIKYESLSKEKQLQELKVTAQKREAQYTSMAVFAFLIGIIGILLYGHQRIKKSSRNVNLP